MYNKTDQVTMRIFYRIFLLFFVFTSSLKSQTIDQVSVGASYGMQTYYTLEDGSTYTEDYTTWDIAFAVGGQDLGIFVNESVASTFGDPLPEVELYETASFEYDDFDTTGMIRILNEENTWAEGAFNHIKNENDPFDFGWGSYNPSNHQVIGNRIFAIKLRSGVFKKLEIQSLISGVYTFRYANLDGSDEVSATISKEDYAGKTLAYYSLETGMALDLEPAAWDLLFTRYRTPLDDGAGNILEYVVTGVLSGAGVKVAQADEVDPETVDYIDYISELTDSTLTVIGHDWKDFDLDVFQWVLPDDRAYFVRTADNKLWKLYFLDFEGSSTGVSTFEKTFITELTATEELESLESYKVFPNPTNGQANIAFELKTNADTGLLTITNVLGQIIQSQEIRIQQGLNIKSLNLSIPAGQYQVSLQIGNDLISQTLIVK